VQIGSRKPNKFDKLVFNFSSVKNSCQQPVAGENLLIHYNCEIFSVDFCDLWGDENCAQLCLGVPRLPQRFPDDVRSRWQPPYCFGDVLPKSRYSWPRHVRINKAVCPPVTTINGNLYQPASFQTFCARETVPVLGKQYTIYFRYHR
jgi:hypothetical protein